MSDGHEIMEPSMNFHRLVAEASHNRILVAVTLLLLDPMHDPLERMLAEIANESGTTLDQASDHIVLAEALRRRDAKAAEDMMLRHGEADRIGRGVPATANPGQSISDLMDVAQVSH